MFNKILPKEVFLRRFLVFTFIFSFVVLGIFSLAYRFLPGQVPLFYSKPWGREQLAPLYFLPLPIGICLLFLILNGLLSGKVLRFHFVRQMLYVGTGLAILLSSVTVLRIVLLLS